VDGERAIRARFPNANPETDKFPNGYIVKVSETFLNYRHASFCFLNFHIYPSLFLFQANYLPPRNLGNPKYISYNISRLDYVKLFQNYVAGVGGPCSVYNPPISYWCAENTQGGKWVHTTSQGSTDSPYTKLHTRCCYHILGRWCCRVYVAFRAYHRKHGVYCIP